MTSLIVIATYFISYAAIKMINYHVKRKETLRVVRPLDLRYLKRDLIRQLRTYLFSADTITNRLLFSFVLLVQLIGVSLIFHYNVMGADLNWKLLLFCFISVIFTTVLFRQQQAKLSHMLDNHLLVSVVFLVIAVFIPQVIALLSGLSKLLFVIGLLPIVIVFSYQMLWLKENTSHYSLQKLIHTMYVFIFLMYYFSLCYFGIKAGWVKYLIVVSHAILVSGILLSYKQNSVDLKIYKKTRHHAVSLSVFGILMFIFMFGGLLWRAL